MNNEMKRWKEHTPAVVTKCKVWSKGVKGEYNYARNFKVVFTLSR